MKHDIHKSFFHFIIFVVVGVFCAGILVKSGEDASILAQGNSIYYVDNVSGNDSSSGTNSAPFKTIAKASTLVTAGGIVRIKPTNTPYQETIQPTKSGSASARITYEGWGGKPRFITTNPDPTTKNSAHCVLIRDISYITIRNIHCDGRGTAPGEDWQVTGFGSHVTILGGSFNTIENNTFTGSIIGIGPSYHGSSVSVHGYFDDTGVLRKSEYNKIINNTVSLSGYNGWHGVDIAQYAFRTLVEGNTLVSLKDNAYTFAVTHALVRVVTSYTIVRNNSISNETYTTGGASRSVLGDDPGERNVYEGNRLFNTGLQSNTLQIANQKIIIRKNLFYQNDGPALTFYRGTNPEEPKYVHQNHIYQNTFYRNLLNPSTSGDNATLQFKLSCGTPTGGNTHDNVIKNNIFFGGASADSPQMYFQLGCNFLPGQTTATDIIYGLNGGEVRGNSTLSSAGGTGRTLYYTREAGGGSTLTGKTLTGFTSLYSNHVSSNIEVDPLFTNPNAGDFTLRSNSPVIDKGVFLTKAYPVSGSTIRFDNPHYFIDGYGLVEGDQIKFKTSGAVRRIQVLDYNTKTAILDASVSLPAGGDDVALVYNGNAPDIGAIETSYTGTPPPTTLSNVLFSVSPETSVLTSGRSFTLTVESGGSTVLGSTNITANTAGHISLPTNTLTPGSYAISLRTAKYLSRKQAFVLSSNQTFTFTNKLLVGDLNNDNIINSLDWSSMSGVWFTNSPSNDLNEDGIVNSLDRALLIRNWFRVGE